MTFLGIPLPNAKNQKENGITKEIHVKQPVISVSNKYLCTYVESLCFSIHLLSRSMPMLTECLSVNHATIRNWRNGGLQR
jgi:hypothetical protein